MNWNEYRENYPTLTFNEKKRLHESWYSLYPIQEGYAQNSVFFMKCIDKIIEQTKKENLTLVEYGGYDGGLAALVMQEHYHIKWINIEIIPHKAKEFLRNRDYFEHVLESEVWIEKPEFKAYDVFLSSSTLEHISDEEIIKLFDYVLSQKFKYLVLLVDTTQEGTDWINYGGGHVLRTGSIGIKKMLVERSYKLKEDERKGISWCSFWECMNNED